jgi:hypothetical protein
VKFLPKNYCAVALGKIIVSISKKEVTYSSTESNFTSGMRGLCDRKCNINFHDVRDM